MIKVKGDTLFEPEGVHRRDPFTAGQRSTKSRQPHPDQGRPTTIRLRFRPCRARPSSRGTPVSSDLVFEATLRGAALGGDLQLPDGVRHGQHDRLRRRQRLEALPRELRRRHATKVPITVKVKGDLLDEVDETLKLELLNNNDVVVRTTTGTIRNDDSNSKMSISDASAEEPGTMTFAGTLSAASAREVRVEWATADGTATAGCGLHRGGRRPDVRSRRAHADDRGGSARRRDSTEENETLKVNLSNPSGIPANNVLDGQGDGTIVDRNAPPSLLISDTIAKEAAALPSPSPLQVRRCRKSRSPSTRSTRRRRQAPTTRHGLARSLSRRRRAKRRSRSPCSTTPPPEPTKDFFVGIGDDWNATIAQTAGVRRDRGERSGPLCLRRAGRSRRSRRPSALLVPRMILGPRTRKPIRRPTGLARMLVACQKASPIGCSGTVELQRAHQAAPEARQEDVTVKKGEEGYASIKLTARGLAILRKTKHGTLRAKVIVIVKTNKEKPMTGLAGCGQAQGHQSLAEVEAEEARRAADASRRQPVEDRSYRRYNSAVVPR